MKQILSPNEMRTADSMAINSYSVPSAVLMENAAYSSKLEILNYIEENELEIKSILFLCGSGNNGGDGFAIARHLTQAFDLHIYWIGDETKMSQETHSNFRSCISLGIPVKKLDSQSLETFDFNFDCIIDALVGVGGSENIKGIAMDILKKIKLNNALKIAIDSPTGLNTENGMAFNNCFKADLTVTMFAIKQGLLLNKGTEFSGVIKVANLGVPDFISNSVAKTFHLEEKDIEALIPKRAKKSSKFNYGKTVIIAGSSDYPGAAVMAANASVMSGSGLTYLVTTSLHPAIMPDVIPMIIGSNHLGLEHFPQIMPILEKADSIVIGCGLGSNHETIALVKKVLIEFPDIPKVIDADALRALEQNQILNHNAILTPHIGEFSKISGYSRQEIEENSLDLSKEFASKRNCIVLLKHIPSIITDGEVSYLNLSGNPALAKGGSGDTLSGIIGALLSRKIKPIEAASLGAYIHSLAADSYISKYSSETLSSFGILNELKYVFPKKHFES